MRPRTSTTEGSSGAIDVHVEVVLSSLERSPGGAITGQICIDFDVRAFPERHWNDFVVVLLGWWSQQCAALLSGAPRAELWFMDGPFVVPVRSAAGGTWSLRFLRLQIGDKRRALEAGPSPGMPDRLFTLGSAFVRSVLATSETVLNECVQRGWDTAEIDQLRRESGVLHSLL